MNWLSENLKLMALCPRLLQQIGRCSLSREKKYFALGQFAPGYDCSLDSRHAGHNNVADEHIRLEGVKRLDGLFPTEDRAGFKPRLVENDCKRIAITCSSSATSTLGFV